MDKTGTDQTAQAGLRNVVNYCTIIAWYKIVIDRLKLLEYRSIDLEARSRRKNILFKGIPENRRENCFEVVRNVIQDNLNIDRDMYLERAHRLGRFDNNKTQPIIVAFRDFCDVEDILNRPPIYGDRALGSVEITPKRFPSLHKLSGESSKRQGRAIVIKRCPSNTLQD